MSAENKPGKIERLQKAVNALRATLERLEAERSEHHPEGLARKDCDKKIEVFKSLLAKSEADLTKRYKRRSRSKHHKKELAG
jgi:hypothetical protein